MHSVDAVDNNAEQPQGIGLCDGHVSASFCVVFCVFALYAYIIAHYSAFVQYRKAMLGYSQNLYPPCGAPILYRHGKAL